jgi:hypothetical protein
MTGEPQLARHGGKRAKGRETVRQYGTSKSYIVARLQREGLTHFVAAIQSGRVTAFAVATSLGWAKRRRTLGSSPNQAKLRRNQLARLMREKSDGRG